MSQNGHADDVILEEDLHAPCRAEIQALHEGLARDLERSGRIRAVLKETPDGYEMMQVVRIGWDVDGLVIFVRG